MIYPATLDITILQNSSFRAVFRALQKQESISSFAVVSGSPFFTIPCHRLNAGDKVVVIPDGSTKAELPSKEPLPLPSVPCGLELNMIYFVMASGLTADSFTLSATSSGSAITVENTALGSGMSIAKPVVLTDYTVDADIKGLIDDEHVATFVGAIEDGVNGLASITMTPAVAQGIEPGRYAWDASLTSSAGERYYWLTGVATVQRTYSRNT